MWFDNLSALQLKQPPKDKVRQALHSDAQPHIVKVSYLLFLTFLSVFPFCGLATFIVTFILLSTFIYIFVPYCITPRM